MKIRLRNAEIAFAEMGAFDGAWQGPKPAFPSPRLSCRKEYHASFNVQNYERLSGIGK